MIEVDGLALPKHHPSILFGDGGTGKSYLALYLAGRMAEKGVSVMLADWELCGDDHRDRLERLFPDGMPRILYARCEKPLDFEADRLRRVVKENGIQFSVFDSIAFASDGPPEAAEVAGRYFRAVRQIGGGSLHVAHVTNGENADKKPFGSAFWSNGARATWYVKQDEASAGSDALQIGLFNRKGEPRAVAAGGGLRHRIRRRMHPVSADGRSGHSRAGRTVDRVSAHAAPFAVPLHDRDTNCGRVERRGEHGYSDRKSIRKERTRFHRLGRSEHKPEDRAVRA